jgi:hypothetical protein
VSKPGRAGEVGGGGAPLGRRHAAALLAGDPWVDPWASNSWAPQLSAMDPAAVVQFGAVTRNWPCPAARASLFSCRCAERVASCMAIRLWRRRRCGAVDDLQPRDIEMYQLAGRGLGL